LTPDPLISNTGRCFDAPPYAPLAILAGIATGLAFAYYVGRPVWERLLHRPWYIRVASHYSLGVGSWVVSGFIMRLVGGPCVFTHESHSRGSEQVHYYRDVLTGESIVLWALCVSAVVTLLIAMAERQPIRRR